MDRHQAGNENYQQLIIAIIATCVSVAVFVVSLRFYVRLVIIRKFGPDDWALAAALVCTFLSLLIFLLIFLC
jgi:divalent metal cation (Fe/Co/Zn/Cd) transporter